MRSAAFLGGQLVANALSGYAFQKTLAFYYGASVDKSIFDIAFSVPTMLIYLSGFGLTHAIVVSVFSRIRHSGSEELNRVFSSLINLSLLVLLGLMALATLLLPQFANTIAVGFDPEQQIRTSRLIFGMFPLAITFGVSSYLSAVAVAWRLPLGQEVLLLFSRLVVIGWVIAHSEAVPLPQIASVLVGSSILGLCVQWVLVARRTGLRYRLVVDLVHPEVRAALHQFGGFVLVAATAQLASIYSKRMGTLTGSDTVALLGYANSIVEPLGAISGKVLAYQVGQPMAVRLAKIDTYTQTHASLTASLITVALVSAVIGLITMWFARPLILVLFGGGEFGESAVGQTAHFVQIMAIGLPPAIVLWVVLYPLLGVGKHLAAMVYIAGHAAQLMTIWLFYERFHGVALAMSFPVGLWVQASLGCWLVARKLQARRTTQPLSGR